VSVYCFHFLSVEKKRARGKIKTIQIQRLFSTFFFFRMAKQIINPSRAWVFTLNNPPEFDPDEYPEDGSGPLQAALEEIGVVRYCSYQLEAGQEGTLHFQGYIELSQPSRFSALRVGPLEHAHWEIRRGTRSEARSYTRKDEGCLAGPWEHGTWTGGQGQRVDLDEASKSLLATRNLREFALENPGTFVRYHRGLTTLLDVTSTPTVMPEPVQWREWQVDCLELLNLPPHPRRVHWFVDSTGGAGKSFMVRYLASNRGALPLSSGRHDRLLNAWAGQPIVTFDFPRDIKPEGDLSTDRTPYAVIEAIKNGVVFSGFFGRGPSIFPVPYVLCFSNFEPDRSKLSADRWDVRGIAVFRGSLAGPSRLSGGHDMV